MKLVGIIMLKQIVTTLLGLMLLASAASADMSETIARHDKDMSWLFISSANGLSFDGTTVTLSEVSPHVVMFADRPRRVADTIELQAFVDAWTKGGDESFQKDPPNAGFTVWADGAYQVSVAELSDPAYDGQKLSFKVKPIEGQLPKSGQHTSVFIDGGCSPWDPRC
jgi:hypothetical protein